MRIPDLEQMISAHEYRNCRNCGCTMGQHIIVFVPAGTYEVRPAYRCMVDNSPFTAGGGYFEYEEYQC